MIEGGPIHTYLDLLGSNENNVMGFSGYQVEGTTGRKIYDGAKNVRLFEDYGRPRDIELDLKIMKFPYSGHSSVDGLKQIMVDSGAKKIFLVHGDIRNQKYIIDYVKDVAKPSLINENAPTCLNR